MDEIQSNTPAAAFASDGQRPPEPARRPVPRRTALAALLWLGSVVGAMALIAAYTNSPGWVGTISNRVQTPVFGCQLLDPAAQEGVSVCEP